MFKTCRYGPNIRLHSRHIMHTGVVIIIIIIIIMNGNREHMCRNYMNSVQKVLRTHALKGRTLQRVSHISFAYVFIPAPSAIKQAVTARCNGSLYNTKIDLAVFTYPPTCFTQRTNVRLLLVVKLSIASRIIVSMCTWQHSIVLVFIGASRACVVYV